MALTDASTFAWTFATHDLAEFTSFTRPSRDAQESQLSTAATSVPKAMSVGKSSTTEFWTKRVWWSESSRKNCATSSAVLFCHEQLGKVVAHLQDV